MGLFSNYTNPLRKLGKLYLENSKLILTEKLTRLVAGAAVAFLCAIFFIIALTGITLGLANELQLFISPIWVYLMVSGFYILLIVAVILLRKPLIINPIARFLSQLILDDESFDKISDDNEDPQ